MAFSFVARSVSTCLLGGLAALMAAIPTSAALAQQPSINSIPLLAPGEGKDVANRLAAMIERQYVLPDVGARYAAMLRANAAAGPPVPIVVSRASGTDVSISTPTARPRPPEARRGSPVRRATARRPRG